MTIIDRLLSLFVVPERERLRNLLVPELADLRQQLDQARRLAGEAQRKYRESGLLLLDEIRQKLAMMDERDRLAAELARVERMSLDQLSNTADALNRLAGCAKCIEKLRAWVAELEAESEERRQSWAESHARATKEQDRADALAVRVKELEAERAKMIEGGPLAEPRPKPTADGQPITYVTPQPEPASDNQGALRYDDFKPTRYL